MSTLIHDKAMALMCDYVEYVQQWDETNEIAKKISIKTVLSLFDRLLGIEYSTNYRKYVQFFTYVKIYCH